MKLLIRLLVNTAALAAAAFVVPGISYTGTLPGLLGVGLVFGAVNIFIRPLLKITQVPRTLMMPIIFVLCVIGSYSLSSRLFDVWTMLGFGVLTFVMRRYGYPAAPFVLGLVLGDILDKNLRRGLVLSDGDLLPFVTRPLSAILAILVVWTFITNVPTINAAFIRLRTRLTERLSTAVRRG